MKCPRCRSDFGADGRCTFCPEGWPVPEALLTEAKRQRLEDIEKLKKQIAELEGKPLLANRVALGFEPGSPCFERVCQLAKESPNRVQYAHLEPKEDHQWWAWELSFSYTPECHQGGWERRISFQDVYKAFE